MMVTLGKHTIQVDEDDAHFLTSGAGYGFQVQGRHTKNMQRWYVKARKNGGGYLHRIIMKAPDGVHVDHINGDGRDNRKANLRLCDRSLNMANARRLPGPSGYIGVTKNSSGCGWYGVATVNRQTLRVGAFDCPEQAARMRDYLVLENFGEFARLNFPESRGIWDAAEAEGLKLLPQHADNCPKNANSKNACLCGVFRDARHARKTPRHSHCHRGHALSDLNRNKSGRCVQCTKIDGRERYLKKKAAVA